MGKNGGKWGKMGRKWGGNGGKGDQLHHPSFLIFPHFSPFPPHFSPFFPIFPHFPPFSPIFPHFPPFFLAMGTLWVRLWVQYPPPEPGTSEPCLPTRKYSDLLFSSTLFHIFADHQSTTNPATLMQTKSGDMHCTTCHTQQRKSLSPVKQVWHEKKASNSGCQHVPLSHHFVHTDFPRACTQAYTRTADNHRRTPPLPQTKVTTVGKNETSNSENL